MFSFQSLSCYCIVLLQLYLYGAVKETIELYKAASGVRAGWSRLSILVHLSRLTQDRVPIAENDQSSQQSTHQKCGKHAGDEDVHVDHLVGLTRLDIPHTYKSMKALINLLVKRLHVQWNITILRQKCACMCVTALMHEFLLDHSPMKTGNSINTNTRANKCREALLGTDSHFTIYKLHVSSVC